MKAAASLALLTALAFARPADAELFDLHYLTLADSLFPAVTVDAVLTTDDGSFYGSPDSLLVTAISGTRGGVAITGLADPFSEIFYPANPYIVDDFGITFTAGGTDFNLVRNNSSFYQEFAAVGGGLSEGRIILDGSLTLTPATATAAVPEPATWALMVGGLAMTGAGMRRRQARMA